MGLTQLGRAVIFLAGAVVGGLALAFVLVLLRPELLPRLRTAAPVTVVAAGSQLGPAQAAPTAVTGTTAGIAAPVDSPAPQSSAIITGEANTSSFAGAVARAAPAVVNIYTRRVIREQVQPSPIEQLFGDTWPRYQQRVQNALGSGVIVDAVGHVVTNNHVIADADVINVQLADGRETRATIVGRDPDTDLAILSIKLGRLPVMPLGRSDQARVGDQVLAIGNPLGLQQTVTHGIISATGRSQLGVATFENFIQTDAAINEGNSGGALVSINGELLGINTAVIAKNMGNAGVEGIGFAIPVNLVRGVMSEILKSGHVSRGWIGVVAEDIDAAQATQLGLAHGGVVITNLYRNSPAANAGLQPGDAVVKIGGQTVRNSQDAMGKLADFKPGSKVSIEVLRGQKTIAVTCNVIERSENTGAGT
jgi:serine protease DegS